MTYRSVIVNPDRRGGWEVADIERRVRIPCKTLVDARKEAFRRAVGTSPCDVVVHDAYNRVVEHTLVERTTDIA
jgi:hypothetical protein